MILQVFAKYNTCHVTSLKVNVKLVSVFYKAGALDKRAIDRQELKDFSLSALTRTYHLYIGE